ncbi:MAG: hypothetical protein MI700_00920 [Balneolales bacterium]|nr:hypothetical protein [Balneolales bacterium]
MRFPKVIPAKAGIRIPAERQAVRAYPMRPYPNQHRLLALVEGGITGSSALAPIWFKQGREWWLCYSG